MLSIQNRFIISFVLVLSQIGSVHGAGSGAEKPSDLTKAAMAEIEEHYKAPTDKSPRPLSPNSHEKLRDRMREHKENILLQNVRAGIHDQTLEPKEASERQRVRTDSQATVPTKLSEKAAQKLGISSPRKPEGKDGKEGKKA